MRNLKNILAALVLATLAVHAQAKTLSVAVAANMMPVVEDLKADFYNETGAELALTQGASGKFAAQIQNGAPFDVFVSADMEYPQALADGDFTDGPAAPYATGRLVLWSLKGADVSSLAALKNPKTKRIALADPKLAPYGRAAVEALKKAGVYDDVEKKLVYGESLSQVNQFVTSGAAEAGFVARSIVESGRWRGKGVWTEVDPALHAPIDQGLVITKSGARRNPKLSRRFADLLLGPKGRAMLAKYGYLLP